MEYNLIELPNGMRVVHKEVTHTKMVHSGIVLDVGSRDEEEGEQGMAHFIEHMVFKGTQRRKAYHISNRLESVGGELNAYTTKEKIYFYASVLHNHFSRAVDLLTDITFHSVFPEKEIQRERGVILEEMSMYLDAPEDAIFDQFDELVFKGHSMGYNILGVPETLHSFSQQDFMGFLERHLNSERIVFSVVGNVNLKQVQKMVDRYLAPLPKFNASQNRKKVLGYHPAMVTENKPINQAHCIIGRNAFSLHDDKRLPFFVLNHLLGGPGMTSRLNMNLREKHGYVYNVESSYVAFSDTGIFSIYFGTEKKQLKKSIKLVMAELRKLREVPLGRIQLNSIKEQLCGQLAVAEESNVGLMHMMGRSLLDLNRIDNLNDVFAEIRAVTSAQLQSLARELLVEDELSYLTYLPQ